MLSFARLLLPLAGLFLSCSSPTQKVENGGFGAGDFAGRTFTILIQDTDKELATVTLKTIFNKDTTGQMRISQGGIFREIPMAWRVKNDSLFLIPDKSPFAFKGKIAKDGEGYRIKKYGGDILLTP